jgi:type II restriction enzyme
VRLGFDAAFADGYKSPSQRVRVLSERWVAQNLYCPACGAPCLNAHPNNRPAADFLCSTCGEDFELKSCAGRVGPRLADGAYQTMIDRLTAENAPNLLVLSYDRASLSVTDLSLIPKHFVTPGCIERRPPLAKSARRAGWVGCTIVLSAIPPSGHIALISKTAPSPKHKVLGAWKRMLFLRQQRDLSKRGWLIGLVQAIEGLGSATFTLAEIYAHAGALKAAFPNNKNPEAKIRQQLQLLRDRHYIHFLGNGRYALTVDADTRW